MRSGLLAVLCIALFAGLAVARTSPTKDHKKHELVAEHVAISEFEDLDVELDGVMRALVRRRLSAEEQPGEVFDKPELDIEDAMCLLVGVGPNFAMCVGNEERSVRFYGRVNIVVEIAMGLLAGPFWNAAKAVDALVRGDTTKAIDQGIEAGLHLLGDPTGALRAIIAAAADTLDPYYAVCATCAMALAWAIANNKTALTQTTATGLMSAVNTLFTLKGTTKTKYLCPLSQTQRQDIIAIASGQGSQGTKATRILSRIAIANVEAVRDDVLGRVGKAFAEPFAALTNEALHNAENTVANIQRPSTVEVTPKEKGGWLVEDLTNDFFDDENPPLMNFKPTFKYRDCQRSCGGSFDVRECSRECRTCDCTIS